MNTTAFRLPRLSVETILACDRHMAFPEVSGTVERVRTGGDTALAELAKELGDRRPRGIEREEMKSA